ncbi:MAG: nitrogenase-associated protein [Methylococcaceae bacterium]|nr:nitrogenase-associated protein [Methylococcaceae bacterium]
MAIVTFYEKPGCASNARQKQILTAAGHQVIAKNLLKETWSAERLRDFFGAFPVRDWFNYSAPAIKLGDVVPDRLTEQDALELMVKNPLLIRRPLMESGDRLMAGFDQDVVNQWIGLSESESISDLEKCSHSQGRHCTGHE